MKIIYKDLSQSYELITIKLLMKYSKCNTLSNAKPFLEENCHYNMNKTSLDTLIVNNCIFNSNEDKDLFIKELSNSLDVIVEEHGDIMPYLKIGDIYRINDNNIVQVTRDYSSCKTCYFYQKCEGSKGMYCSSDDRYDGESIVYTYIKPIPEISYHETINTENELDKLCSERVELLKQLNEINDKLIENRNSIIEWSQLKKPKLS